MTCLLRDDPSCPTLRQPVIGDDVHVSTDLATEFSSLPRDKRLIYDLAFGILGGHNKSAHSEVHW